MKWFAILSSFAALLCGGALLLSMEPLQGTNNWATKTIGSRTIPATNSAYVKSLSPVGVRSAVGADSAAEDKFPHSASSTRSLYEGSRLPLGLAAAGAALAVLAMRASRRVDRCQELSMAAGAGELPERHGATRTPSRLQAAADASMTMGTPVPAKTMLVVGATGTLGRQIVRQALDAGYDVRCLVRPRQNPADFLRDWGAKTVNGNLANPKTLPAALVGVHTVVDVATARPEESIRQVDWEGKKALIQCAKAMGIQRYIFFSIVDCDKAPDVPLMDIKRCTEQYLEQVGLKFTVLRTCGFMQALIQQYAVPMLEGDEVYGTKDDTRIAYLSTQDAARMTLAALQNDDTIGKTITLAGPKAYSVKEVIALCEKLGGMEAKVNNVPVGVLGALRRVTGFFGWSKEVSDRLAFSELLSNNKDFSAPMEETYKLLRLDPNDTQSLESYLNEYYKKMLVRLKEVKAKSGQKGIVL